MLEIFALISAISAIAAIARARGGNAWRWGVAALGGYLTLPSTLPRMVPIPTDSLLHRLLFVSGWVWLGATFLAARFVLGRGRAKPDGMWVCPNCKMLNQHFAIQCDACGQSYARSRPSSLSPW